MNDVFLKHQPPIMNKVFLTILIAASAAIFSCSHVEKHAKQMQNEKDNSDTEVSVMDADEIRFNHKGPTVAPKYNRGYTITITPEKLTTEIKSYDDVLLTKKKGFTQKEFDEVLNKFKKIKSADEPSQNEIAVGGSSESIVFLKDGKKILTANNYDGVAKNYSGVKEISLSNLVPNLDELLEQTKKEDTE